MKLILKQLNHKTSGFTLIETLVMIAIIGLLGAILTNTIIQIFRSQTKTAFNSQIRQNAQSFLDKLDYELRGATRVCVANDKKTLALSKENKSPEIVEVETEQNQAELSYARFRFIDPLENENGYVQFDTPELTSGQVFSSLCQDRAQISRPLILTNADVNNGVSVKTGATTGFHLDQTPGNRQVVTVSFLIGVHDSIKSRVNQEDVPFSSTIELRNTQE